MIYESDTSSFARICIAMEFKGARTAKMVSKEDVLANPLDPIKDVYALLILLPLKPKEDTRYFIYNIFWFWSNLKRVYLLLYFQWLTDYG